MSKRVLMYVKREPKTRYQVARFLGCHHRTALRLLQKLLLFGDVRSVPLPGRFTGYVQKSSKWSPPALHREVRRLCIGKSARRE